MATAVAAPDLGVFCLKSRPDLQTKPDNYRRTIDLEEQSELESSIARLNIRDPLHIRPIANTILFEVVNGNRRLLAYDRLGLNTPIPCLDLGPNLTPLMAERLSIVSNVHRSDPNIVDTARGIQRYKDAAKLSLKEVCDELGLKPARVSKWLTVLTLPEDVLAKVASGEVPLREAYTESKKSRTKAERRKKFTLKGTDMAMTILADAKASAKSLKDWLAELQERFSGIDDEEPLAKALK